jgi:predicted nuclease with TOPRIM domain
MAEYATKADLKELQSGLSDKIDKAVDDLSGIIRDFAQAVDERFDRLEKRVDKLEEGQARLIDTLDHFLKRLDDIEKDNTARDAQLARLERWIEQVARKTGIKLEY